MPFVIELQRGLWLGSPSYTGGYVEWDSERAARRFNTAYGAKCQLEQYRKKSGCAWGDAMVYEVTE